MVVNEGEIDLYLNFACSCQQNNVTIKVRVRAHTHSHTTTCIIPFNASPRHRHHSSSFFLLPPPLILPLNLLHQMTPPPPPPPCACPLLPEPAGVRGQPRDRDHDRVHGRHGHLPPRLRLRVPPSLRRLHGQDLRRHDVVQGLLGVSAATPQNQCIVSGRGSGVVSRPVSVLSTSHQGKRGEGQTHRYHLSTSPPYSTLPNPTIPALP